MQYEQQIMAPSRSIRSRVAPTTHHSKNATTRSSSKQRRNSSNNSVPIVELVINHHPPDIAAGGGGYVGMEMGVPYCQEITPATVASSHYCAPSSSSSSRKGMDPPDVNEVRSNGKNHHRRSSSTRRGTSRSRCGLAPLEEGSNEGSAESPKRRTNLPPNRRPISRKIPTTPKNGHRHERRGRVHSKMNAQYNLHDQRQSEMAKSEHSNRATNEEPKKNASNHSDPVTYQQHRAQHWKKQPSKASIQAAVNTNCNVSELTFRGLPDPPDRLQRHHKSSKTNVMSKRPPDPPAQEDHTSTAHCRRLSTRKKSMNDQRFGGKQPKSSSTSTIRKKAKEDAEKRSGQRRSESRTSTSRKSFVGEGAAVSLAKPGTRKGGSRDRGPRSSNSIRASVRSSVAPGKAASAKREKKNKETSRIKSILKKKEVPPPAFFGGQSTSSSDSSSLSCISIGDGESSAGNKTKSASTISYDPKKITPSNYLIESGSYDYDDDNDGDATKSTESASSTFNSVKSVLRQGKFAAKTSLNHHRDHSSAADSDDETSFSSASSSTSHSPFSQDGDTAKSNFGFDRTRSHFLRTADLGLTQDTIFAQQFLDDPNSIPEPHYHHPTPHPPPGIQFNIDEHWICIDDGNGAHSPIAPQAVDALVAMGYRAACDPMMWTPTSKTRKYMAEKRLMIESCPLPGPIFEGEGGSNDASCLLWSGSFRHRYYGSELPAIRSQGFVNKSAEELVDLLMDSARVGEYNKSSAGRIDEVVLSYGNNTECPFSGQRKKRLTGVVVQGAEIVDGTATFAEDLETDFTVGSLARTSSSHSDSSSSRGQQRWVSNFVGVTKLVRSRNRIPLIKKTLEFTTLLHCRELLDEQGGNGYIIVGRSTIPADDTGHCSGKGVIRSEMLLNVIIIRRLHQRENGISRTVPVGKSGRAASTKDLRNRCLLITMNHLKCPLMPKLIAKRVGLSAATNFMSDIRAA